MAAKVPVKLILVGPSGVGKTSLVSCFFKQKFENQTVPTVAPAFCSASIEVTPGKPIDLQIWDTAGQEQFQSISQMFYRDSHVAFVCFDPHDDSSIEQWVERVRTHVPDCQIILVVMKSDLMDVELRDKVATKREGLIERYSAKGFFITSSKTGEEVHDLFSAAARLGEQCRGPNKSAGVEVVGNRDPKQKGGCC